MQLNLKQSIIKSRKFNSKLRNILSFIAKDSVSSAKSFKNVLDLKIKDLVNFPYVPSLRY